MKNNFAISADIDEMTHIAAFHQGLHCVPNYLSASIPIKQG